MSTAYSTERPAGKEHHLAYPKGFIAARIVQLVLGIITLALSAYIVSGIAYSGAALELFTALVTLIASIYILVSHYGPTNAYNYWAILGLDVFLVIFWLISWALQASVAAAVFAYASEIDELYSDNVYDDHYAGIAGGIVAGDAALGAIIWITYIATLVIHSMALHRHRKAGLRAMPGAGPRATEEGTTGAEKVEMQPQQPDQAQGYYAADQTQQHQQQYADPNQQQYVDPNQQQYVDSNQTYTHEQQQQQQYYQQSASPMVSEPTGGSYADPNAYGHQTGHVHEAPVQH
ncbi:hypothetical protein F5Y16DRAFT_216310 [Xylariaceae sp. FL0255]|nr:hypothetical protein F5Y16DRAFT_216310 [Xylariaceae sp. FL0255]